MKGFQDKLALMVKYIIHIFSIVIFLGCLICKCVGKFKELNDVFHTGHGMGNDSFKDLIDFGTFSLVRVVRNLTPLPQVGCGPLVALGLD